MDSLRAPIFHACKYPEKNLWYENNKNNSEEYNILVHIVEKLQT